MVSDRLEAPEVPEEAVGRRVTCGGERATVRFVGLVPPTKGVWLGVEWDNPERGKHNGEHEGVTYFTCSSPSSGSFVRPSKVSFGLDYESAVKKFYETNTDEILNEEINFTSKRLEWARLRERSLQTLPSVILNRTDVNGPGEPGAVRNTTPNVRWLDLSRTLIGRWEDVASIAEQMEALEGLQLSFNRLTLTSVPGDLSSSFSHLTTLALNECALCWSQVLQSAPMWPQLQDLRLDGNNITCITDPGPGLFQDLKSLSLSGNPLDSDSVLSLAFLPRLQTLNLSETGLSALRFTDSQPGEETKLFPVLHNLNLDHNNITEWGCIDELDKLASLSVLSLRGNRLRSSDGNTRTANQIVIAKLRRITQLNGHQVEPDERRGAELDYLKLYGGAWLKAGGRSQLHTDFLRDHPRFTELIEKHGEPEEGELKKPETTLKNQLLRVCFQFPGDSERKSFDRKLPGSMELQKVKTLVSRITKVSPTDLILSYCSHQKPGTEFLLENDLKSLDFYSVQTGDTILIRLKQ